MRRILILSLFSLLLLGFFLFYDKQPNTVAQYLETLDTDEKTALSLFFEELVVRNCFGYTLFGDKPVSVASYFLKPHSSDLLLNDRSQIFLHKGSSIWEKSARLPFKDFILKFELNDKRGVAEIFLINIPAFKKTVEAHLDYFREVLGANLTSDSLLDEIKHRKYEEALHFHEGLIGILYGFGKHNSQLFQKLSEITNQWSFSESPPYAAADDHVLEDLSLEQKSYLYLNKKQKSSKKATYQKLDMQKIKQEYVHIQHILKPVDSLYSNNSLSIFRLPTFRADFDDRETLLLAQKYLELRRKLTKIYSSGDFLEVTLQKLVKGQT